MPTRAAWSMVATLALTGCGRLGFDAADGAPVDGDGDLALCPAAVDHDEDGDGVDDACDGCPHVADAAQADRDDDGVGDACDPNPDAPGERILVFDPFTEPRPEWRVSGASPAYDGETLSVDTRPEGITLELAIAPARDHIELGLELGEGRPAGEPRHVKIHARGEGGDVYYCELYQEDSPYFALTRYAEPDGYQTIVTSDIAGGLEHGEVMLRMEHAPPNVGCATSWPTEMPRIEAEIPDGVVADRLTVATDGLVARYLYFVLIRSE